MLARRRIQQLIDGHLGFLSDSQVTRFVRELNASGRRPLSAEWELIVLASLSSLGSVEHEAQFGGTSRLDVSFKSAELGEFVADVRTISDDNYFRDNPVNAFAAAFSKHLRKVGLSKTPGGFYYRINSTEKPRPYPSGQKITLRMPRAHQFSKEIFATKEFRDYIRAIADAPNSDRDFAIESTSVSLSMVYGLRFRGGRMATYPSFNNAHDLCHNVLSFRGKIQSDQESRRWSGTQAQRCIHM